MTTATVGASAAGLRRQLANVIGYAVVRAIADTVPQMSSTFVAGQDGQTRVVRPEHVGREARAAPRQPNQLVQAGPSRVVRRDEAVDVHGL